MRISDWSSDVCSSDLANAFIDSQSKQALFDHMLSMSGPDVVAAVNRGAQAAAGKSAEHAQLAEIIGELVGPVQSGEGLPSRLLGVRFSSPAHVIDLPGPRIAFIECDYGPFDQPNTQEHNAA